MSVGRTALSGVLVVAAVTVMSAAAVDDDAVERERCPGQRDDPREQVVGTEDDDILSVPEGAIGCGLGGNDILEADKHGGTSLYGGPGDDVLCARNLDADRLYGGSGEDRAKSDDEDVLRDIEGGSVLVACHRT